MLCSINIIVTTFAPSHAVSDSLASGDTRSLICICGGLCRVLINHSPSVLIEGDMTRQSWPHIWDGFVPRSLATNRFYDFAKVACAVYDAAVIRQNRVAFTVL